MSSQTESAKETLPWGVTAQGINALYKLHGRGMIVCKQKTKDKQLDSVLRLVTDVLTCFVGFLKGYHYFFSFFFSFFSSFCKDISRSRYWDCWNVLGIHSTLQTSRLESGSNDYCLAHPGFFLPLYYHTDKKDTFNKTEAQQQSILKIALVLPFLCFSPNHTNNSYSNYCRNIVKCYLTSFSLPRSLSWVY